ncbi:unnamed protein product, partial [Tilletia laevis]
GQDSHAGSPAPHVSPTPSSVSPAQRERNTSSFDSATVNTPEKTAGSKTKKKKLKNFFFFET